jgi:hypothetical protein
MKTPVLLIALFSLLTTLISCNKSEQPTSAATIYEQRKQEKKAIEEQIDVGNNVLLEINELEKNLKFLKFVNSYSSLNGVYETYIQLEFDGETVEEAYEAKKSLEDYSQKLELFLKDYPAPKYTLSSRVELEKKLEISKAMLEEMLNI